MEYEFNAKVCGEEGTSHIVFVELTKEEKDSIISKMMETNNDQYGKEEMLKDFPMIHQRVMKEILLANEDYPSNDYTYLVPFELIDEYLDRCD